MYQIDEPTAVPAFPAAPAPTGTPGWFIGGNSGTSTPGTRVRFWWLNMVQQELLNVTQSAAGLAPDKTNNGQLLQALNLLGRRLVVFAVSGTWTVPPGVYEVSLWLWGAGGCGGAGGGGGGGGGSGGGFARQLVAVTPGQVITVTIGIGGIPGAPYGGTTSFGSLLSATGGGPGGNGPNGAGSIAFGTGAGSALLNIGGSSGSNGVSTSTLLIGGQGGGNFGLFGGQPQVVGAGGNATGNNGQGGAGGSGGVGGGNGGNGGNGLVIAEY